MKEYKATLHGYKIVKPARCTLERLEPTTKEIVLPLHYAESAPVAMRVTRPLMYTGHDGQRHTYSSRNLELLALDGKLWKPYGNYKVGHEYRAGEWTIKELASFCASCIINHDVLTSYPWQYGNEEPETGLLVRDRGTWATLDNLHKNILSGCERYASIGGNLYEPANELVYRYDSFSGYNGRNNGGRVVCAEEYNPNASIKDYMCNALQNWREVNHFTPRWREHIIDGITGADVIEVLMPEYVKADPHADYLRHSIETSEEKARHHKRMAKKDAEAARKLREDAKTEKANAAKELENARAIAEELDNYLKKMEA